MMSNKSSNTIVMRKSDKATNNSHNFKSGQNNVVTSKFRSGNNGKASFFGARRNTLTTSTNSSGFSGHRNAISSGVHQQKKWQTKNRSQEESVISASSCSNSNNTANNMMNNEKFHQPKTNVSSKLRSVDSVNTGCGSSQTSGHHSQDRNRSMKSTESFDMKDVKAEIKAIEIDDIKSGTAQSAEALELQQIQEAKPGNKRALLVDLPPYLYSIPALASFFEPYGEVAMLQILPQKRMWDADLIDLLGASMCNKLANQSLCAVVEFYSARMAKFIIGILRKRLPILKFRCALLKPSAAIELTNQAENLGLNGVVVMKNKPVAKNTISTDSGREHSHESDHEDHSDHEMRRRSELESGCEDVSSSDARQEINNNNRLPSYAEMSESESEHSPSDSAHEVEQPASKPEGQRFVTSFQINLGR
jgi:hypothetical protein